MWIRIRALGNYEETQQIKKIKMEYTQRIIQKFWQSKTTHNEFKQVNKEYRKEYGLNRPLAVDMYFEQS